MSNLCDDKFMQQLLEQIESDNVNDLMYVDELLLKFPDDYRLHFMRGSILAERQKPIEAHAALSKAVDLEPYYILGRYQLGFFELTSGEANQALSTWGALLTLPKENYFRVFVEGLTHLIRDEFSEAITLMNRGIQLNDENPLLNNDIKLLIIECEKLSDGSSHDSERNDNDEQSATSFILNQFGSGTTKH